MEHSRNSALDFTKGILLIVMILHHSLSSFPMDVSFFYMHTSFVEYTGFVSGAFIFVAGFLISNMYLKKYNIHEKNIYFRLLSRSIKLILIFTVLNIVVHLLFKQTSDGRELSITLLADNIYFIYIPGMREIVSFDILLPIAYAFLMAGALLLIFKEKFRASVISIFIVLFIYASIKFFYNYGAYNLRFITIGLCGIALGFSPLDKLNPLLLKHKYVLFSLYGIYLLFAKIVDMYFPVYTVGIILNLLFFYTLGMKFHPHNFIVNKIMLIGKYALISYIIHIAIIEGLHVFIEKSLRIHENITSIIITFVVTAALMFAFVNALDYYKKKISYVDRLYRVIFT